MTAFGYCFVAFLGIVLMWVIFEMWLEKKEREDREEWARSNVRLMRVQGTIKRDR